MVWWWIGNAVFALVVIPVVVTLLHRLTRPVLEIGRYVDDALEHGLLVSRELQDVTLLHTTHDHVRELGGEARRYGAAVATML